MTVVDFTTGTSGQSSTGAHWTCAAGAADFPDGQNEPAAHDGCAVGEHDSQPTNEGAKPTCPSSAGPDLPDGHPSCDAHSRLAVGEHNPPAPAMGASLPKGSPPVLASTPWADSNAPLLALLADALDDIENMRTATANRLRQLTRTDADKDGEERGFGLTLDQPQVATVAAMVKAIKHDDKVLKDLGYDTKAIGRPCPCLECSAIRNLKKAVAGHPLGPWLKATVGVGEKQGARLLASIGDPYWNTLHDRPRLVSELWQYAGHGDPARSRRRRGQLVEYSPTAKTRAYLVALSCMRNLASPYRPVYDERKAQTEGRLHASPCVRCGPSGQPAQPGSPWSDGHRNADALRVTAKEILKDLWRESKRLHEQDGGKP